MQYSDTTNKNGIIQMEELILNLGDAGISGNSTLLKQITAFNNAEYYDCVTDILKAQGEWRWDDPNYGNFPEPTKDLVNGQQDYKIPGATTSADFSTFLTLIRVEVKDAAGNFVPLQRIDDLQINVALSEFHETNGMPQFYREEYDSVFLYPKPATGSVTTSAGIKFVMQRTMDEFTSADTTQQPGFAALFHERIPIGAALRYAAGRNIDSLISYWTPRYERLKQQMMEYYADRNKAHIRVTPASRKTSYV